MTNERKYDCKIEDVAHIIKSFIEEKLSLSIAIEDAKRGLVLEWKENGKNLTLDSAVEFNKYIRNMSHGLKYLVELKGSEQEGQGSGYKFNVEGNQVIYKYPVIFQKIIDYDRNIIRDLYKKLVTKADTISTQIDEAMLKDVVKFMPKYDIHDSIEDIIEKYKV
jgi:hypothetical protein